MPRTQEQLEKIKEQTRSKIIDAAIKLFSQNGYHGTSINEIAKEAGISKGLAYNYFTSKQHLLEAIFEEMMQSIMTALQGMDKTEDPYEKLRILIDNSFSYAKSNEEIWRLYMRIMFQPDVVTTGLGVSADLMNKLFEIFEKIFKAIGYKNARIEARLFSATIDGLMLYYLMDPSNFPLEKVKKLLMKKYSKAEIKRYLDITEE